MTSVEKVVENEKKIKIKQAPTFSFPNYKIIDNVVICDNKSIKEPTSIESNGLVKAIGKYIEEVILYEYDFISIPVPAESEESDYPCSSILASRNWESSKKLMVLIHNAAWYPLGILSRSICLNSGITEGSMLPYIKRALSNGYAIIILRPNYNSVEIESYEGADDVTFNVSEGKFEESKDIPDIETTTDKIIIKHYINGCENPTTHAVMVWDTVISQTVEHIKDIVLVAFGNGAALCKDIIARQVVRSNQNELEINRIKAMVTIEGSKSDWTDNEDILTISNDLKAIFNSIAINMECNKNYSKGQEIYHKNSWIPTVSLGLKSNDGEEKTHANASYVFAINEVFQFLKISEQHLNDNELSVTSTFLAKFKKDNEILDTVELSKWSIFKNKFFGDKDRDNNNVGNNMRRIQSVDRNGNMVYTFGKVDDLCVTDFDYLKVLGKGAFGKVMLVRLKSTQAIFAMKILKMVDVIAQGQIKHAFSEKEILRVVKHPFIVQLRFSFRSASRLYLVTDYYSGDTLFFHLRREGVFNQSKTKFYGAEILSALAHLHAHKIIYRDLKLENILMDSTGHVSITDFGLSKQNVDFNVGVTTFCGSPQYVPPEILASYFNTEKKSYGPECDWWSFGILLYEMLIGKTPFFDKNRKIMFHRIMNSTINFPSIITSEAAEIITRLLKRDPAKRLGAGENGRNELLEHEFFSDIDFELLNRREIPVPFVPNNNKFDLTKKTSKTLLAEARDTISVLSPNDVKAFEGFSFMGEEPLDDERESKYGR